MTQEMLAEQADVSVSFLSQLENDRREYSAAMAKRLASAVGVPIEVLFWHAIEPPDSLGDDDQEIFVAAKMIVGKYIASEFPP